MKKQVKITLDKFAAQLLAELEQLYLKCYNLHQVKA